MSHESSFFFPLPLVLLFIVLQNSCIYQAVEIVCLASKDLALLVVRATSVHLVCAPAWFDETQELLDGRPGNIVDGWCPG